MNDILFEILKAVLVLVIVLLARYTIPYAKALLENSKYDWMVEWVVIAVKAAEQTIVGDKRGEEKKDAVISFVKKQLAEKNITLSDEQLNNLIESAVYALNSEK